MPSDDWNTALIHEAFSHRAARDPEAVAVRHGAERFTYRRLESTADHYAARLAGLGAGRGRVVPVLLEKSPTLVAALLAVLKTGAAYAALDPRWPRARVAGILDQIRAPFVIAEDTPDHPVPAWNPFHETVPAVVDPAPRVGVTPGEAASVFFTSGSGGVPKGVISPHRGTTRLFPGDFADFGPGRVMAQTSPVAWDGFSLEVWGMLTTGGRCVIPEGTYFMPDRLRRMVTEDGLDTLFLTTSLFNLFVAEDPECFTGLRQVLTGGERASATAFAAFLRTHPGVALIHCYGPAEATVFTTTHRVTASDPAHPLGVPLGTAVPETAVHLLDGEICVSGSGLGIGYLADPELTARRFGTVTIAGEPVRIYRTGDLGVRDHSGTLHFRGRVDRQVKIAGHRIEPGDVEDAAARVPGVEACAVLPESDDTGRHTGLVLCCVIDGSTTPAAVRRSLADVLPRYLVPDRVLPVAAIPLNPNGKVDHVALAHIVAATGR
ncbi:amino acid adenylation domain-containing protein [Stackebrandtia albiflava]|uniref:Amino acid adenylation domain-containing protein n=1 Tax=Stackebrandtia albiflava TaxID=406432 RepID=A0A562VCK9_9ACTN|nr:AMP-binding protein [Stackebrandtia albiflava]TWJ15567.1 amino acid adenylation domain-containing protein [Stackebrandtia albiflava]